VGEQEEMGLKKEIEGHLLKKMKIVEVRVLVLVPS
jgi:hypothetical protein